MEGFAEKLAARLRDPMEVKRARVFPYQLMVAFNSVDAGVPDVVRDALQDAMEVALGNVPEVNGHVVVAPDVSGSMSSPVTGHRKGSTSVVRCIDVAALVAAALLRRNPTAKVLPFENDVVDVRLNARDSVMTNAQKLAAIGGGGTNCSAPLARLVKERARVDLVVFVSDNQSWVDGTSHPHQGHPHQGTATMQEWRKLKALNPGAKLVCIDIQPYTTVQAKPEADILNVGGFSDRVFDVVGTMLTSKGDPDHWVRRIDATEL